MVLSLSYHEGCAYTNLKTRRIPKTGVEIYIDETIVATLKPFIDHKSLKNRLNPANFRQQTKDVYVLYFNPYITLPNYQNIKDNIDSVIKIARHIASDSEYHLVFSEDYLQTLSAYSDSAYIGKTSTSLKSVTWDKLESYTQKENPFIKEDIFFSSRKELGDFYVNYCFLNGVYSPLKISEIKNLNSQNIIVDQYVNYGITHHDYEGSPFIPIPSDCALNVTFDAPDNMHHYGINLIGDNKRFNGGNINVTLKNIDDRSYMSINVYDASSVILPHIVIKNTGDSKPFKIDIPHNVLYDRDNLKSFFLSTSDLANPIFSHETYLSYTVDLFLNAYLLKTYEGDAGAILSKIYESILFKGSLVEFTSQWHMFIDLYDELPFKTIDDLRILPKGSKTSELHEHIDFICDILKNHC